MSLDSIVSVDISISSPAVTKPGFGTALILSSLPSAVEALWATDRVRKYSSAAALLAATEGFTASDQAYKMAVALFAQNPKPQFVKVGRRTRKQTQILKMTPTITTVGHVYSSKVNGKVWTYTVVADDDTAAKVVVKLIAAITAAAPTDVTASSGTSHLLLTTSTAGKVHEHSNFSAGLIVQDVTDDPGIVADFTEISAIDKDFYAVTADTFGSSEISALATAVEATKYRYTAQTADTAAHESGSSDIGGVLNSQSIFRTEVYWSQNYDFNLSLGHLGVELTKTPGTYTNFGKVVALAIPSDSLTETQIANLSRKKYNYYQTIGNNGRVMGGWVAGGEYSDTVRGLDWLRANMQVNIANALFSADKIPNTDAGREVIKGQIAVTIEAATSKPAKPGLLAPDPAPTITMPPVSDTESFDSTTRTLTGVEWSASLANAIHAVVVTGKVSE